MTIGSWGADTVRGVVNGQAGEWRGTVIHVDVVAFYPDDEPGYNYWPVYSSIKAIPSYDTVKVAGVWEEDMEIGRMGPDDEQMAELLGVAVEKLSGEDDTGDGGGVNEP